MNTTVRMLVTALAAVAVVGCGPSAKEKQMAADLTAAQSKSAGLETKVGELSKENADLKANLDQAQSQVASLNAEKEALKVEQEATVTKHDQLVSQLASEVESGNLKVRQFQNILTVEVAEQVFFASGSSTLKAKGKEVLLKVGEAIKAYPDKYVRIVGHTDNVPIKSAAFASNWELSTMRATNVVRFLQDKCGLEPGRLIASGRGPYQPVADNSTPEGRQQNRRIEIMLIDRNMAEPAVASSPTAGSQ